LFAALGSINQDVAFVIFFKISSADARRSILERLFKKKFGTSFNLFRNSLIDQLRPIDIERNEIVHWNVVNHASTDAEGETIANPKLLPPTFWTELTGLPEKDKNVILAFSAKCTFYARLINMFLIATNLIAKSTGLTEADAKTWHDIFSQPITYPPPLGHPLSRTGPEPDSPSQAFRV
jgi:hypothetical protein